MDLSDEQKERRLDTAKRIERFILPAIMSMYYMEESGGYDYSDASETISDGYRELLEALGISMTAFFSASHPESTAAEIVAATMNHPNDPYYFSMDRVMLIAENEANSIWNDGEYQDAIMTGKRWHRWSAIIDSRTRETHREVNGVTLPISEPFEVGGHLMMYPRDEMMGAGPEEIVNCRCSALYF